MHNETRSHSVNPVPLCLRGLKAKLRDY